MKNYVVGFAYNTDASKLVLIRKNRPEWQEGKLNGVGGHVEHYDNSPLEAMVREFSEETGVFIPPAGWQQFCVLSGKGYVISVFKTFTEEINNVKSITDEMVSIFTTTEIPYNATIRNLAWLIPMSLEVWSKHPGSQPKYDVYAHEPDLEIKLKRKPAKINLTIPMTEYFANILDPIPTFARDQELAVLDNFIEDDD